LKDEINSLNINLNIKGDNLLSLNIVFDEMKHIFSKLIAKSIENFKSSSIVENKQININFEDKDESIYIIYSDNAVNCDKNENFDLGFYLVKVFVEKNFGLLNVEKTQDGIKYIIRFDK
jgi:two-component system sensor histidine kinase/response regulator